MASSHRATPGVRLAAALVALIAFGAPASAQPPVPDPNDQPQFTAEPPVRVPDTASCAEVILENKFDGWYLPNENDMGGVRYGEHTADACPGPWSKVVLDVDVTTSGINYDRVFEIFIGRVPLLSSSTTEPVGAGINVHWHTEADVSQFAGMLASDQPITAILNNTITDTYNGVYHATLTLRFYAVGETAPAIVAPDYVAAVFNDSDNGRPVNFGTSGYPAINWKSRDKSWAREIGDLPPNLVRLFADVRAQGHGACEEFWWSSGCGSSTPKRQVELLIDGEIAGFAPVYPVLFTGANGPANWMPIPSPRAWHLDPYRLDLTPFIGRLVDGNPHTFAIRVPDASMATEGDDFWMVGATLFGHTDPELAQTSGELTSAPVAASPADAGSVDYGFERSASWSGYVVGSSGRVDTQVDNAITMTTQNLTLGLNSEWNWTTTSRMSPAGGEPTTTTVERLYSVQGTLGVAGAVPSAITLGDAMATTVDGPQPFASRVALQMTTSGAGLAAGIAQTETYCGSDSSGWEYTRMLTAAGGYLTSDQGDLTSCPFDGALAAAASDSPSGSARNTAPAGGMRGGSLVVLDLLVLLGAAAFRYSCRQQQRGDRPRHGRNQ